MVMRKAMLCILALICISAYGFSQELWVDPGAGAAGAPGTKEDPIATFAEALGKIPDGGIGTLHLAGVFYEPLSIKDRRFESLDIRGGGVTTFYGFEGEFKLFDVEHPPAWRYACCSIKDARNVTIKNLELWGNTRLESIQKDPALWLDGITFDRVTFRYGSGWTVFSGAYTYSNLTFVDCLVTETCYKHSISEHGIYLSGGHWEGSIGLPPVTGIKIIRTHVTFSGGRHGIQLNGRFEGVLIDGCDLTSNMFGGLSLIGCRNVEVRNCKVLGNNRQGIVVYEYFDSKYFDETTAEGVSKWKGCHHESGNIILHHNTVFVGPEPWWVIPGKSAIPHRKAAILINMKGGSAWPHEYLEGWGCGPFVIENNILASPWKELLAFQHVAEAWETSVKGNVFWTYESGETPGVKIPFGAGFYDLDFCDLNLPTLYKNNVIRDPKFTKTPDYPTVYFEADPFYNFGKQFTLTENLYSEYGARKSKGKRYQVVWIPGKGPVQADPEEEEISEPGKPAPIPGG